MNSKLDFPNLTSITLGEYTFEATTTIVISSQRVGTDII